MDNVTCTIEDVKSGMMKDEEFKSEYDRLKPRYEVIEQIIRIRNEQNISQSELAKRVGTQKSNISRLESGNYNPSLNFLVKVVRALGKSLSIKII